MEFFQNLFFSVLFTALISLINRPKRTVITPNTLSDFTFNTALTTRPIQDAVGTVRMEAANTLWAGDFHTAAVTKKTSTGLFTSTTQQIGNNYFFGFALGLCYASPGIRLTKIWVDDNLAWSGTLAPGGTATPSVQYGDGDLKSGIHGVVEFHSADLTPSAYLESQLGVGQVPAYSHLTYLVFRGPNGGPTNGTFGASSPLGWVGASGSLPKIEFELTHTDILPTAWIPAADLADYQLRCSVSGDANPAYVLYRLELHDLIGTGLPLDLVDWTSFHAAAAVLLAEDNGWSNIWDSARSVYEYRQMIEQQINGSVVPDPVTGKLSLHLLRDTDTVKMTLSPSNIAEGGLTSFKRVSAVDATNEIVLAFNDRTNVYVDRTAAAQDLGSIELAGQVNSTSVQFTGVTRPTLASTLTLREVRAASAPLAQITAVVNSGDPSLRPGDPIIFMWPDLGITALRMRLTSVEYRDLETGQVDIEATEDVFSAGANIYASSIAAPGNLTSDSNTPPAIPMYRSYMIPAPWAIAQQDYDRPMLLVSPSTSAQKTFDVVYSEANCTFLTLTAAQWDPAGPYAFSVSGDLATALSDTAMSISVTLNAVNGALLKTLSTTGGLLCLVGNPGAFNGSGDQIYEFLRVTAYTVSTDGLSATLTVSKRGIFDTYPGRWDAGVQVWVIPQVCVDPSGLASCLTADTLNGPAVQNFQGELFRRPWVWARNGAGVYSNSATMVGSTTDGIAQDGSAPGRYASRAPREINAGEPMLGGIHGAYSRSDATLPTIASSSALNGPITISWQNRWKNSKVDTDTPWATGTGIVIDNTIATQWYLQKLNSTGTGWTTINSGTVTTGAQSVTVGNAPFTSDAGSVWRVIVSHYMNVAGTVITPYNVEGGEQTQLDNPRARHYRIT